MTTEENVMKPTVDESHKFEMEHLTKTLQNIKESTRALEREVSKLGGNGKTTMSDFKEKFVRTRDAVVNGTKKAAKKTDAYVTQYPWVAAGVFAGLGILAGMMLKRRPQ
jgi:ElaB/YqjD/DUF883 family membrane-anchored ribosome-binding protein